MRTRTLSGALALVVGIVLVLPTPAPAQVIDRLKDAATREAERQIERLLRDAIRCALNDPVCPQEAEEAGEEVIYVDEEGEVIVDDDGVPITDRDEAHERAGVGSQEAAPGEGAWANYDFVPGDDILFFDDYSGDRVGDFPRRMSFVNLVGTGVGSGQRGGVEALTQAGRLKVSIHSFRFEPDRRYTCDEHGS